MVIIAKYDASIVVHVGSRAIITETDTMRYSARVRKVFTVFWRFDGLLRTRNAMIELRATG